MPKWLSKESLEILELLLQVDPKKRIPIKELANHPWIIKEFQHGVSWRTKYKVRSQSI